jgi:hypothetical protein
MLSAAIAVAGGVAGAAPRATPEASGSPVVLHFLQVQSTVTFYNASGHVIAGYPPLGGHVLEDDLDYVGDHAHHAKTWTATDHLYCTVVGSPAAADCNLEIAIGGSLLYADALRVDLAANAGNFLFDGGTGTFAGYSGIATSTNIGSGNDSDLVVTVHKG